MHSKTLHVQCNVNEQGRREMYLAPPLWTVVSYRYTPKEKHYALVKKIHFVIRHERRGNRYELELSFLLLQLL